MSSSAMALTAPSGPSPVHGLARLLRAAPPEVERSPAERTAIVAAGSPITWVEPAEPIWRLTLKNVGLTLATFGIWHFWGRAEARRQLVNAIRVNGRPLDYTGSGREGFGTFLVAAVMTVCVVWVTLRLLQGGAAAGGGSIADVRWYRLLITLPLLFLLGSAAYRRRHHFLKRTWLDGDRFRLTGHPYAYAAQHFWTAFLVGITLGWAGPWRASRLEARKIREMAYRDQHFQARPELGGLYRAFAIAWFGAGAVYLGVLIALGVTIGPQILASLQSLSLLPLADPLVQQTGLSIIAVGVLPITLALLNYRTAWIEHRINAVATDQGRLRLRLPRLGFLWLSLGNLALLIATLGLAGPVAEARTVRYIIAHLSVEGRLDLSAAGSL
jgi:uncharacterized membrane protein YjgN (DUF898 family)